MIGINLIDASLLAARRRRRRLFRWGAALACTTVLLSAPLGLELSKHQQVQSLKGEKRVLTARIETTRASLNRIGIELANLRTQMARASALRTKRSWSRLLALIAQALPEEIWLVSIATDPPAPPRSDRDLTQNKPSSDDPGETEIVTLEAPQVLEIEGFSLGHANLYGFMSKLKATEVFEDVSLTKAWEEPVLASTAVRFKIRCRW